MIKQDQAAKESLPLYTTKTIEAVRNILMKAASKWQLPGYTIMGKTGTARLLTKGKYDEKRNIFTFAGIVEKGNYKRIIITCLKETTQKNAYASTTTAPLFSEIVKKMIIHDKVM